MIARKIQTFKIINVRERIKKIFGNEYLNGIMKMVRRL